MRTARARTLIAFLSLFCLLSPACSGAGGRVIAGAGPAPSARARSEVGVPTAATPAIEEIRGEESAVRSRSAAAAFVRVQQQLEPFKTEEGPSSATHDMLVPVRARPLLQELKRRGAEVMQARLAELIAADPAGALESTPDTLSAAVLSAFTRAGAVGEAGDQTFGKLDGVSVEKVSGDDALFAAVLSLSLTCGSDSTLFIYRFDARTHAVAHVLTAASHNYASISDGQLGLTFAVSPRGADGDFYVVTAHASPWCASLWRSLEYRAYAPSADPEQPNRLVTGKADVWLDEGVATLDVRRDRFEIEFLSWDELGMNVTRPRRRAYARKSANASVFRPAAPTFREPADLPNTWVSLDWERAKALVAPGKQHRLRAVHALWQAGANAESGEVALETSSGSRASVRFSCDDCTRLPRSARFVLERSAGIWRLSDVR